MTDERNMSMKL